jgi:hypothetical protein
VAAGTVLFDVRGVIGRGRSGGAGHFGRVAAQDGTKARKSQVC